MVPTASRGGSLCPSRRWGQEGGAWKAGRSAAARGGVTGRQGRGQEGRGPDFGARPSWWGGVQKRGGRKGGWKEEQSSSEWGLERRGEAWCQREGVLEGAEPGLRGVNKQAGRDAAAGRGPGLQRGVGRGNGRRRDQVRPGPEVEVGPGFGGVTG